ncbi:hypothetical protein GCM10027084_08850 [Pseudoxanthomonas sangjuensis]|uniref:GIY-YIG nuclease family protein n=1 Tax=Pseudoxanthomonas sangjuensis TaxID=1503750 RepID=UPI001391DA83|nr:GIY-YIG nuclease family protein [Pseudoxanthomonas sangjuensis]
MANDTSAPHDRAAEVERLLDSDETMLGRFWQYEKLGLTPQEMAEQEETATFGWVYNCRRLVRVLRDGEVPTAPAVAQQAARKVRAWLKNNSLSNQLRLQLEDQEKLLSSRAEDRQAQTEETVAAVKASESAEAAGTPGIYVYTLPHYLRHPIDPDTGKTLLKVGHSTKDAYYRAGSANRLTALPEDPILLRIYPTSESSAAEKEFHTWLRSADHSGARGNRTGTEWFVTSLKFLDRIAASLKLEIRAITDFDLVE